MQVQGSDIQLNNEEFMCLVIRECGTRFWSGQTTTEHQMVCRFCSGELKSHAESRRRGEDNER